MSTALGNFVSVDSQVEAAVGNLALPQREPDVTTVRVRDALVALGELVARAEPGQTSERVGPAHDLIPDHLVARY